MKIKIEVTSKLEIDDIIHALQNQLSTKELICFSILLGNKLTEEGNYYEGLKEKLNKIKI